MISLFGFFDPDNRGPEKIYTTDRVNLSEEYYREQVELWKVEIEKDKGGKETWLNYFMANYALYQKGKTDNTHLVEVNKKAGPLLTLPEFK